MKDFKKGFMTTMGVLFGMGIWVAVTGMLKPDKNDEKEAEKTE